MQQAQSLHRCFYAVRFDDEVTSYVAGLIRELQGHRADVKWIPRENIHLTLRFLGEINDAAFERAQALPDEEPAGHGFLLRVEGLGAFPLLRAPRVLWAGVGTASQQDRDHLLHLQKRTEVWAERIGLPPERKRYRPHVTLGRVRPPFEHVNELMDDMIARECLSTLCPVDELLLMRSTLERSGAHHETVKRWKLKRIENAE